jgi:ABC-type amino acid transport substrate-binding protein
MMGKKIICGILFGWSLMVSPAGPVYAEDPIKFAGTHVPDLFDEGINGPYQQLFDLIEDNSSSTMELSIAPYNRSFNNFRNMRADCLFTGVRNDDNFLGRGVASGGYIMSDVINILEMKAYTRDPAAVIETFESMKGNVFAGTHAIIQVFRTSMPEKAKDILFAPVDALDDAFQLVEIGKAHGVLSFASNALILQRDKNAGPGFRASATFNLRQSEEAIICHNTERNDAFIEETNRTISDLKKSGKLDRLFGLSR